jgi:anti-anti-sigma factor
MPLHSYVNDPSTSVHPTGEIDLSTVAAFHDQLAVAIESGRRCLVIDMAEVIFIDSTGLTELVHTRNQLLPDGGVVLRNVPKNVRRVLGISGLERLFTLEDPS